MRIMMIPTCVLTLSILAALLHGVTTLRLVDLKVPPYIIRGQPVRLECHYDLEGEALYSVKWFKNNQEFFRFLPEDDPPAQVFSRRGVYVDLPNSSDTAVVLRAVDENSSGEYRCEVSGEAPSFKTVMDEKTMVVVDLPDASGPQLDGLRPRYQIGELVAVNCSSARSRPAAQIFWYINQEPADEAFLHYYPIMLDEDGLQTSMLGLEFRIRRKHLEKGDLKIKCLATIDTLYWRSSEQTVDVDRPHNSAVLESRGGAFPGASSGATSLLVKSSSIILTLQNGLFPEKLTVFAFSLAILLTTHKRSHYFLNNPGTTTVIILASLVALHLIRSYFNSNSSSYFRLTSSVVQSVIGR